MLIDRLSGLWGAQTPMGLWLEDNEMTTLFISGVNIDQCVFGTFIDALYKVRPYNLSRDIERLTRRQGYDAILIQDASATSSPSYATDMVLYNAALDGFV